MTGSFREKLAGRRADAAWYALCFALLGLIDQRRFSAPGAVQMAFANLTGAVVAMLLWPSVKREFWRTKYFKIWSVACVPLLIGGFFVGKKAWPYFGQWNTAVLNVALFGYEVLYVIWDLEGIKREHRLKKGCFLWVMGSLLLMWLSPHEDLWPLWFFGMFGSFYLIGVPKEKEESFLLGMLSGVIAWFFVQQTIAFGFRPFDYVRYRGLYSGVTFSGLFYMVVFCAFTGMWLFLKQKGANPFLRVLCFLLSAGSVGFQLLTGGRSSFVGIFAAALVAYMAYDVIACASFRHWIMQGIVLGVCALALFPAVYGAVRYLPTILHHPIWFEGEYDEETSVRSFDPWDSERYVSFETVVNTDIARLFEVVGIRFQIKDGKFRFLLKGDITAHAAELGGPGSSPENPFFCEGGDVESPVDVRKSIYYYYASHLNLWGHGGGGSFYLTGAEEAVEIGHAHNMFLQMAYNYGIVAGLLFLAWNLFCFVRLLLRKDLTGIVCAEFLAAILAYGLTEMASTIGQITWTLLFIIYYFGIAFSPHFCYHHKKQQD